MILPSVRKQAGAKFLAPRFRGLLDLWREGYQHRRGAEDSHTSVILGRVLTQLTHRSQENARETEGVTKQEKRKVMLVKEKGIFLVRQSFITWPKTGRSGREKAVSQT